MGDSDLPKFVFDFFLLCVQMQVVCIGPQNFVPMDKNKGGKKDRLLNINEIFMCVPGREVQRN